MTLPRKPVSTEETSAASTPQPMPIPREGGDVQALVIADIEERRAAGIAKYGTPLQANNGRDAIVDAYQEALDLACYLRQFMAERRAGGWISCEERLPEEGDGLDVVVYGQPDAVLFDEAAEEFGDSWPEQTATDVEIVKAAWLRAERHRFARNITHWHPLPAPPTEGGR